MHALKALPKKSEIIELIFYTKKKKEGMRHNIHTYTH